MKRCPTCKADFPDEANFCPADANWLVVVSDDRGPAKTVLGLPPVILDSKYAPKTEVPKAVTLSPKAMQAKTDKTPPPIMHAGVVPEGQNKSRKEKSQNFRETLWFKKGELDAVVAAAAADALRRGNEVQNDKSDSMPMAERYKDDGSLTHADESRLSLRGDKPSNDVRASQGFAEVSEAELIRELRGGRKAVIAGIIVGVVALLVFAMLL